MVNEFGLRLFLLLSVNNFCFLLVLRVLFVSCLVTR